MHRLWLGARAVVLFFLAVSGDLAGAPATRVDIDHEGGGLSVHHRLRGLHFAFEVRPHRYLPLAFPSHLAANAFHPEIGANALEIFWQPT